MGKKLTAAAALLAFVLIGVGCSHGPSDAQLATKIKSAYSTDNQLNKISLEVSVKNGFVTLSGEVPSVSARYEAYRLAVETPGVKKVTDEMSVQEASLAPSAANTTPAAPAPAASEEPRRAPPRHRARRSEARPESSTAESPSPSASQGLPGYPESGSSSAPASATAASTRSTPSAATPAGAAAPAAIPAPPPPVENVTIPENTLVSIRMVDTVDSASSHTGDIFHATLANPIMVDGKTVAPRGADVYVQLVESRSAGHLAGWSELRLELYRIIIGGKSYQLVSNDYDLKGPNRSKRSALAIIGGAVVGAAIGAIAGGGKGAAIGAATGGGGGAVYEGATKTPQVRIPSETLLNFKLQQAVAVTISPDNSSTPAANQ